MMKKLELLFLAGIIFTTTASFAFNKERCHERFPQIYRTGLGREALFSTTHPTETFIWSSQITSSWGECSLLGLREQRSMFVAANTEKIMMDAAKGGGEYVSAVAMLSGCYSKAQGEFSADLQRNFEDIFFSGSREASVQEISSRIDGIIVKNPNLRTGCVAAGQS